MCVKILIATPYLDPIHPLVNKVILECHSDSNSDWRFDYLFAKGSDLASQREKLVSIALNNKIDAIFHFDNDQPYDGKLSELLKGFWNRGDQVIGCAYPWREANYEYYVAGYLKNGGPNGLVPKTEQGVIKVGWCGHGSMFVRTDLYCKMEEMNKDRLFYDPEWCRDDIGKRHRLSESIGFGVKCERLDVPVILDCMHVFRHEKLV